MTLADWLLSRMRADAQHDWHLRLWHNIWTTPDAPGTKRATARARQERARKALAAHVIPVAELTRAETRALIATATGLRAPEAAKVLGVTEDSFDAALLSARRKLRAKNTTHAVANALRQGLIP